MKGKLFLLIIILIVLIAFSLKFFYKEEKIIDEYTPQEEISEEQERLTIVTLYFLNKETNELFPEPRQIDAKLLIEKPEAVIFKLLLEGPKNEKLESIIPKGTKLNSISIENGTAIVDLSTEFIRGIELGEDMENKIIYSIVNSLIELSEIDSVKILIDGHEGTKFDDGAVDFKNVFTNI